jgi:mono/diheme cytochrome c family protein
MEKMKNNQNKNSFFDWRILALLGVLVFVGHLGVIFLFSLGQNYGRMNKDEAVNVYEMKMPDSVKETVPLNAGPAINLNDPDSIKNPLPADEENEKRGWTSYTYYCIQCHGPEAKGKGTVGQSFSPLPANLRSTYVQAKSDGQLFKNISLGYKRHPPLAYTVSEEERWAIIIYIRSLAELER